jgi:hypothetical protein
MLCLLRVDTCAGPVQALTCADRHLAGLASPQVYGVQGPGSSGVNAASNLGHNKRVAILPQGFDWAHLAGPRARNLPTCVTSWSDWVARSPYGVKDAG